MSHQNESETEYELSLKQLAFVHQCVIKIIEIIDVLCIKKRLKSRKNKYNLFITFLSELDLLTTTKK